MMDRLKIEAVREGVRRCKGNAIFPNSDCPKCPYDVFNGDECRYKLLTDVVEILDNMKPVKPTRSGHNVTWWYSCGACGAPLDPGDAFCRRCGKAVGWE